jgi:hypothetical protein
MIHKRCLDFLYDHSMGHLDQWGRKPRPPHAQRRSDREIDGRSNHCDLFIVLAYHGVREIAALSFGHRIPLSVVIKGVWDFLFSNHFCTNIFIL